jgi:hypothetical protein
MKQITSIPEQIASKLAEYVQIQNGNPTVMLGGSVALILLECIPPRDVKDIDVISTHYIPLNDDESAPSADEFNGKEYNGIRFDYVINDEATGKQYVLPDGSVIIIQEPKQILNAKLRYYNKGKARKHLDDIANYISKN